MTIPSSSGTAWTSRPRTYRQRGVLPRVIAVVSLSACLHRGANAVVGRQKTCWGRDSASLPQHTLSGRLLRDRDHPPGVACVQPLPEIAQVPPRGIHADLVEENQRGEVTDQDGIDLGVDFGPVLHLRRLP